MFEYDGAGGEFEAQAATEREWLIANGAGAYASSSLICLNTRKYHGLLVCPQSLKPVKRLVMLQKIGEKIRLPGGKVYELGANKYPGTIHPKGYEFLQKVTVDPDFVLFEYKAGKSRLEKRVSLARGENRVNVDYVLRLEKGAVFEAKPMLAMRGVHEVTKSPQFGFSAQKNGFAATDKSLEIAASNAVFEQSPLTYYNICYEWEKMRGYEFEENLFSPGFFRCNANAGSMRISAGAFGAKKTVEREPAMGPSLLMHDDFFENLYGCAKAYLAKLADGRSTVIAGYPWFFEWTRDAMISLDGLCLQTGHPEAAAEILQCYAKIEKNGMLPNTFDYLAPVYNAADAPLWFVYASCIYAKRTGDMKTFATLAPSIKRIIDVYLEGNDSFYADKDMLIRTREGGLTWMDAKTSEGFAAARIGKPVELNALWYNCLMMYGKLSNRIKSESGSRMISYANAAKASFAKFQNTAAGCLYDVIEPQDAKMRPNQIYAIGLEEMALDAKDGMRILRFVEQNLLTPYGLRSLAKYEPGYIPMYAGSQTQLDKAYHNGAIWPYLLGAYFGAKKNLGMLSIADLKFFEPLEKSISGYGIGHVSELYDPTTLKQAGSPFQAWSCAEVLRAYKTVKESV